MPLGHFMDCILLLSPDIASVSVTSQVNKVVCDPLKLLCVVYASFSSAKNVLQERGIGFYVLEMSDPNQHLSAYI